MCIEDQRSRVKWLLIRSLRRLDFTCIILLRRMADIKVVKRDIGCISHFFVALYFVVSRASSLQVHLLIFVSLLGRNSGSVIRINIF